MTPLERATVKHEQFEAMIDKIIHIGFAAWPVSIIVGVVIGVVFMPTAAIMCFVVASTLPAALILGAMWTDIVFNPRRPK